MHRKNNQTKTAFTLLELLVVIAITALMIGMLIPSLKRSVKVAAATVCMHNLKELGHGLELYKIENRGWLPVAPQRASAVASISDDPDVWFLKLYPSFLEDLTVLSCPGDPYRFEFLQAEDPVEVFQASNFASYGINSFIMNAGGGYLANTDRHRPTRPLDTILLADLGPDDSSRRSRLDPSSGPYRNAGRLAWDDGMDPFAIHNTQPWVTSRHTYGVNMLALDGNVREVSTDHAIRGVNQRYYRECAAGGCTLCRELQLPHYSFARSRLYWWTGPMPSE